MSALLVLVLAQLNGPVAPVDLRGHSPAVVQSVLEGQLATLATCRVAPAEPKGVHGRKAPVVRTGPVEVDVLLVISPSGAVATVKVPAPGAFVEECLRKHLLPLEFGARPREATARETFVTATLRCSEAACRWTWMAPPDAGP